MSDFNNRLSTNWKLLFAVADLAGGKWPKRARQAATKISKQDSEPSQGRRLLAAIDEIFQNRTEITSAELVACSSPIPRPSGASSAAALAISQHQLAGLLGTSRFARFRFIRPSASDQTLNGYSRLQFEDAFARFLPSDSHTCTPKKAK